MSPQQGPQISIEGLRAFQRDVKTTQPGLRRDVPKAMQKAAEEVALPASRALTPSRTGRLRASERVSARGIGVAITSRVPYANVIHWGGTTGRHHSRSRPGATRITKSLFAVRAIERTAGPLVDAIGDELAKTFRRNGWD